MTREEFIKQRCEIDKITEEEFEKRYRVVKCNCGQSYCKGYRCLDLDDLLEENQELKKQLEDKENIACNWKDSCLENAGKIEQLQQENKQLKDNLNKLKDYIKDRKVCTIYDDFCRQILNKMQELEGNNE